MATDPGILYRQLGRLIEAMPFISGNGLLSPDEHLWLGRADALVMRYGSPAQQIDWKLAKINFQTSEGVWALEKMRGVLYALLAAAELEAPASAQGAFIPAGNGFDAFAALSKVLKAATRDVLIVDPYMDEAALTEFACAVPENVPLRLMADKAYCKSTLRPAADRWVQQYGTARPLMARLAPQKSLHDRAVFIDHAVAWTLTQSLKDFAKRSPAEIVRADEDTSALKIIAYEDIWASAAVIV